MSSAIITSSLDSSEYSDTGKAVHVAQNGAYRSGQAEDRAYMRANFILPPDHTAREILDAVVAFALIYNMLVVPFRVAFARDAISTPAMFALEVCMDFIFVADLVVTFRTAVEIPGGFIKKPREIARNYFKGWFAIDFLSVFPFDLIIIASVRTNRSASLAQLPKTIRFLRLLRLVRLLRMFRLSRLWRKWNVKVGLGAKVFRPFKIFLGFGVLAHFFSCLWFFTGSIGAHDNTSWTLTPPASPHMNDFEYYLLSYYWAVMTIITVGYGDVKPVSSGDMVVLVFVMLVGVTLYSYGVGSMTNMVLEVARDPVNEKLDEINSYLDFRCFPAEMRSQIRVHYVNSWRRMQASVNEKMIFNELSSKLRKDVALFIKDHVLKNNPLFRGTSPEFVVAIIMQLQPQSAMPGEVIVEEGDYGQEMFMLNHGTVEVISGDGLVHYKTIHEGSYFGEIALVTDDARRVASCRAVNFVQLDILTRQGFRAVVAQHPEELESLSNILRVAEERAADSRKRRDSHASSASEVTDEGAQSSPSATPKCTGPSNRRLKRGDSSLRELLTTDRDGRASPFASIAEGIGQDDDKQDQDPFLGIGAPPREIMIATKNRELAFSLVIEAGVTLNDLRTKVRQEVLAALPFVRGRTIFINSFSLESHHPVLGSVLTLCHDDEDVAMLRSGDHVVVTLVEESTITKARRPRGDSLFARTLVDDSFSSLTDDDLPSPFVPRTSPRLSEVDHGFADVYSSY